MTRDEVIALAGECGFATPHDAVMLNRFAAAIEARVLDKALTAIDAIIRKGELPEPQHSERNGTVLAYNVIQSLKE